MLDDYHLISEPEIHEGMRFLLQHLPLTSHLVIATRAEPPVDLSRLRARGELGEIVSDQLRFSDAEAAALLNDTLELALPAKELQALSASTEGWAAGLYLAGLSLRDGSSPTPRRPTSGTTAISWITSATRCCRRRSRRHAGSSSTRACSTASARGSVTPCAERTRRSACSEKIEQANLFLVPLDGRREWFRYHHVFRDVLLRELEDSASPEYLRELHARAGAWLAGARDISGAVTHLLAAGQEEAAADLIAAYWNEALQRGRSATVVRWLEALPVDLVTGDPRLCLARAWLAFDSGEPAAAEHWADATAAADNGRPLLEGGATVASSVAMLRATLAYRAGDLASAEALGTEAVELENRPDSTWRAVALATLGAARHFRGSPSDDVVPLLEQAVGIAQAGANSLAVLRAQGTLAAATFAAGDLEGARRWVAASDLLRAEQSLEEYWMGSLASAVAGQLAAAAGNLGEARERLERAVVLARRAAPGPSSSTPRHAAPVEATIGSDAAADTLRARGGRCGTRRARHFEHLLDDTGALAAAPRRARAVEVERGL